MICEKCIHNNVCCDEGKDNEALKYCADFIDIKTLQPQDGDLISRADMILFLKRGREYIGRNRDQYKTASEFDVADEIYVNMIQAVEMMPSIPKTIVNNGTLNIQM